MDFGKHFAKSLPGDCFRKIAVTYLELFMFFWIFFWIFASTLELICLRANVESTLLVELSNWRKSRKRIPQISKFCLIKFTGKSFLRITTSTKDQSDSFSEYSILHQSVTLSAIHVYNNPKFTFKVIRGFPAGIYLLKVNKRNTRTRCKICSELTIKTSERRQWRRSGVFIDKFEHISHLALVFLLLTLNM